MTCQTFAQSQAIDINLVYPDSCSETATFLYYQNPDPNALTPKQVPRFGASNFTLYASNVDYALLYGPGGSDPTYAGMLNLTCAIGMGTSAIQTVPAKAVFPAVVASNGQSVICMMPDDVIPAGVHDVRVSFNGQQYLLPTVSLTAPEKVSITAYGPVTRVKKHIADDQHTQESSRLVKVPIELLGQNRRLASVGINVTYGGATPMPGSTDDLALVQVQHARARDNSSSVSGDYDFSVSPLTVHWEAGDTDDAYVYIHIVNDDIHEADLEALTLTLVNAENCDIEEGFENRTAIVTIKDEDAAPMFEVRARTPFYPPLYRDVREKIQIPIDMVAGGRFTLPAVIEYTAAIGTSSLAATPGIHYANVTAQLTWQPEQYATTQYAEIELDWSKIPLKADLRLHVTIKAISEARVATLPATFDETTDAAAFIYGVPQGSCPPGTTRSDPSSWVAPPPLAPAASPPPPSPPPPAVVVDSAILSLSVVANSTAATANVFPSVPVGIALSQPFDPAVYAYTGVVDSYVVGVQVYYQLRQALTTVASTQARRRLLAASEVYMKYYALQTGANVIQLTTTSPNGQHSERYTLTITRDSAQNEPSSPPPPPQSPPPPPSPPPWTRPPPPPPAVDGEPPPAPPTPPPPTAALIAPKDTTQCAHCPAGTFSSIMNALECTPCAIGRFASAPLSDACAECSPGEYMHVTSGVQCAKCPMDSYANVSGTRLCVLCGSNVTTSTVGSSWCDVKTAAVPKENPDVYFVDVAFGISFHQMSGSLSGFAPNVGLDASDNDAFARALEIDVAKAFNVTRSAMMVDIVDVGSSADTQFRRRRRRFR